MKGSSGRGFWGRAFRVALALTLGVILGLGLWVGQEIEAVRPLLEQMMRRPYRPAEKTKLYASDGTLLLEVFEENREFLPLERLPEHIWRAVVAIEDHRFFSHPGVDARAILRALRRNWRARRLVEGGSTLTQQWVRGAFLSQEKTWRRKLREILLALVVERLYSKEEILEFYLNEVYFGHRAYGIKAAAEVYFGKSPEALTTGEAALLAGLLRNPSLYDPFQNPSAARRRRNQVLARMVALGWLTPQEAHRASQEALPSSPSPSPFQRPWLAPYFTLFALQELKERLSEEKVLQGGLRVMTTLNPRIQRAAEEALRWGLRRAARYGVQQGACVVLSVAKGEILALVGGRDFQESQFDRATQALRPPGSAFKPFIYAAALERGYLPDDEVLDAPVVVRLDRYRVWRPSNFDGRFHGRVPLEQALVHSLNAATLHLAFQVGLEAVAEMAQRLGIRTPLRVDPALALGASEVRLLEMTAAYLPFANGGLRLEPTALRQVSERSGGILLQHRPQPQPVLSPEVASTMNAWLRKVVEEGTGRGARCGLPAGGKTGTSSEHRDVWFIGFTPDFVVGLWMGNDDRRPLGRASGGEVCAPIWARLIRNLYRHQSPLGTFPKIPGTIGSSPRPQDSSLAWCILSGALATPHCPIIRRGTPERQEPCPLHPQPQVGALVCDTSGGLATRNCRHVVLRFYPGEGPTFLCPHHRGSETTP